MSPSAIEVEAVTDTSGITIPNPLTVPIKSNEIYGRRRKADKSQWGTAAPANSANFRHRSYDDKPKAKRWDRKHCFCLHIHMTNPADRLFYRHHHSRSSSPDRQLP